MNPQSALKPTITQTVESLMTGAIGRTRQKAIVTLAKRKNIPLGDARFHQAVRIAQSQTRKNNG